MSTSPAVALSDPHMRSPVVAANTGDHVAVAWESDTGGPVQLRIRGTTDAGDTWAPVRSVGASAGRSPALAVSPDGTVTVAIVNSQGGHPAIGLTQITPTGTAVATIPPPPGPPAVEPRVAVDGQGNVTVLMRVLGDGDSAQMVVWDVRDGRAGGVQPLGPAGHAGGAQLSVAPDGTAGAGWVQDGAVVVSLRIDGRWSPATRLDDAVPGGRDVAIAAGAGGTATAVWVSHTDDRATVTSRAFAGGAWGAPATLDTGDGRARELARPGRSSRLPGVAVQPDGSAVAAWTMYRHTGATVRGAQRDLGGRWGAPRALSGDGAPAGGVGVGQLAGAAPLVAWEEIDAGLLRVRVQGFAADDTCRDLGRPTGEHADVHLAGVARPLAVYLDLNRGRVMAVDLP